MQANIEDRGPKGECTPLMEAASGGFQSIVELLVSHGADVNATSNTGTICFSIFMYEKCVCNCEHML